MVFIIAAFQASLEMLPICEWTSNKRKTLKIFFIVPNDKQTKKWIAKKNPYCRVNYVNVFQSLDLSQLSQ